MSGESRQKVNLAELIGELIKEITDIDSEENISRSEKTKLITRAATKFKTKLHDDKRRKDAVKISLTTYRKYMTTARNAVTELNLRHHSLGQQIERLAKKYPEYSERLEAMGRLDHITEIRLAHKELLNGIKEHGEAYDDIKGMKLDHEVMRHLTVGGGQKAQLAELAATRLEEKKQATISLPYHSLISRVQDLLVRKTRNIGGQSFYSFSRLALGIGFATGRRAVEVLWQGQFEKAGDNMLRFRGQAKKRGGADYSDEYTIYTTVDADIVMNAIAQLRQLPEIKELAVYEKLGEVKRNDAINKRCAKTLNTVAKEFFKDESRVFKDSRAVWARMVYELHFKTDPRWAKKDEDIFWREMLGHDDVETQKSYKQFKLEFDDAPAPAAAKPEKFESRLDALAALDAEMAERKAMNKIHEWAKGKLKEDPDAHITQTLIIRELGSNRAIIKEYLDRTAGALSIANAVAPVPAVVAGRRKTLVNDKTEPKVAAKPSMKYARIDADHHEGWVEVDGKEVVRVQVKGSAMDAMRAAFDSYKKL